MGTTVPSVAENEGHGDNPPGPLSTESERRVAGDTTRPTFTETSLHGPIEASLAEDHAPSSACGEPDMSESSTFGEAAGSGTNTTAPAVPGYEVLGELGRGGMGVVYLARQVRLQRPCALKMILAGHHAGTTASARFLAEAETVAKLRHPNIVQIHAIGDHDGRLYIELEFIEGGSLARKLDGTPWVPLRAAGLVETLARATGEAHRLGIVHRDLKPGNVLLTADGTPKLSDFGLAKSIDSDSSLTQSGAIVGSPSYMAPEQAEGNAKRVGPAADLYALGAILYELLTGRPPFRGATVVETLQQVKLAEPVPPSRQVPGLPRDVETVVLKCLQKDPARRYESAAALADDLHRFQAGESIVARPVGAFEHTWRWCCRNPSLSGSLAAVASALVALAVLAVFYADVQSRSRKNIAEFANVLEKSLATSNQRLAALYFERGQIAFEKGQTRQGLLWMIETWRSAFAAGDLDWQHTARANLAAWQCRHIGLKAVFSHQGEVNAVAFSPDGKAVLTGGYDYTARLWDAATGQPIGSRMEHEGAVLTVAFSFDGKAVLTGSQDATARLWDAATGEPIGHPLAHKDSVQAVAFSPDGRAVLTGSFDNTARLWDAGTGEPIGSPLEHQSTVWAVAFSPDGKAVLTGSLDSTARLWDAGTGKPIGQPLHHTSAVYAVAFSPDGKAVLTGSKDTTARLWDAGTGKPIGQPLEHAGAVYAVAFSPDGKALLTGSLDKTAQLWDAGTGKPIGRPMEHTSAVYAVAFSPDGKAVVSGGFDNTARLWDAETGEPIGPPLEHQGRILAVAFSPDSKVVLTGGSDSTARLWDTATGEPIGPLVEHQGEVQAVAFSPDGKAVLTGSWDKTARLWDAVSGKPIGPPLEHQNQVEAVAFGPDGKTVVTGSNDNTARLWNSATGKPVGLPLQHENAVRAVAFSPDGVSVLTGSEDKTARLWDAATGKPIGPPMKHTKAVYAVAFSPDGKTVVTGSEDKTARVWAAATGQPIGPPLEHQSSVTAVTFSPDGKAVLTGSFDNTARLWDPATGEPVGHFMEHLDAVRAVAFSPDGKAVLTGSNDNMARLWDASTGMPIGPPLEHRAAVRAVAFSPDGKVVITGSDDKTARVWTITQLPDDFPRLTTWVELITGLELDGQGSVRILDNAAWRQRRERLDREGGPPDTGRRWGLDPILFGPEPTARARAWIERGRWTEAETAFNEIVLARPFNTDILLERARYYTARSRPDKADDDFVQAYALGSRDPKLVDTILQNEALVHRAVALVPDSAVVLWSQRADDHALRQRWAEAAADYGQLVRLQPENLKHRRLQILSYGAAGDLVELSRARSGLLDQFGTTTDPIDANSAAWIGALAPGSDAHAVALVRMAEVAVSGAPGAEQKEASLNTLGAALYRAARFEDAIRRLEEGIQLQNGISGPEDWIFLAMSHHRLGHRDQAHNYLERLRYRQPITDPEQLDAFWKEVEIGLLKNEAEAIILYDPIFPADPFRPS